MFVNIWKFFGVDFDTHCKNLFRTQILCCIPKYNVTYPNIMLHYTQISAAYRNPTLETNAHIPSTQSGSNYSYTLYRCENGERCEIQNMKSTEG